MTVKERLRVYVAGPYSCDSRCEPLGVDLTYMRKGLEVSVELLKRGYAPFCPWLDYLYALVSGGKDLERRDFYEHGIAWLYVSDVMFVHDLRRDSIGTMNEIELAKEISIPVVYDIEDLGQYEK